MTDSKHTLFVFVFMCALYVSLYAYVKIKKIQINNSVECSPSPLCTNDEDLHPPILHPPYDACIFKDLEQIKPTE